MRHCFQSREDVTYADRFDKLVDSLIQALDIPISGQQQQKQNASTKIREKMNSGSIGIRSTTLDINGRTGDHNARSPIAQAFDTLHDDSSTVAAQQTQEHGSYGELLSDYAYLGNFQLWPVAPLYEIDQFDPNRGPS
jgi:hypothetical protein